VKYPSISNKYLEGEEITLHSCSTFFS